ncbi:MAG: glycoside hydrolase family 27 protein [Mangrovibacterium sp.]
MKKRILFLILLYIVQIVLTQAQESKTLGAPMGWNSWSWFGKYGINEDNMKQCMDAIVDQGLLDAGYEYFVIDGGWRASKLGPHGELLANQDRFPKGIKALTDYAHFRGLKFGLHTVPGTHDCGNDEVGGFGYEDVHVKQLAEWGVDFIKLDKCKFAGGWDEKILKDTYEKWHKLLSHCGRDIVLSISAYQWRDWYPEVGQMARTTFDIGSKSGRGARFDYVEKAKNLLSVMEVAEQNNSVARYTGNGYWNDPDMLVVGDQGLTIEEQKAHFALWCIMTAPLMLGNDPRDMTEEEKEIVLNEVAIAIDQDPTEQGKLIKSEDKKEIWAKKLKNGRIAVLLLNRDEKKKKRIILSLPEIDVFHPVKVKDIYSGEILGSCSKYFSQDVRPKAGLFLLLSPE